MLWIEEEIVISYMIIVFGCFYSVVDVDELFKVLYVIGLFVMVEIILCGGMVVVIVMENLMISWVLFEGNKKIKDVVLEIVVWL